VPERGVRLRVEAVGYREAKAKLRDLPREARDGARDAAQRVAEMLADEIRDRAASSGDALTQAIAGDVGIVRGAQPNVKWPGSSGVTFGRNNAPVSAVIYGAEFGGQGRPATMQFRRHSGTEGYVFFPTVRAKADETAELWGTALDAWIDEWDQAGET
jgi:hypothetical protein